MAQPHAATSFCTETNFLVFLFPLCKSIYKIKYLRMKSCHKVFFQRFTFVFKKGILIFFYKKKRTDIWPIWCIFYIPLGVCKYVM